MKGFVLGENELIDTSVAKHYIDDAEMRLKKCLEHYMVEPQKHLETYSKYTNNSFPPPKFLLLLRPFFSRKVQLPGGRNR